MTAPVWMALPPEVHSAQLSSGPGPGGLLAAAAVVEFVERRPTPRWPTNSARPWPRRRPGRGRGRAPSSTWPRMLPYLAWLMRASANSAAAAAQQETAATAYTAALAAMPTLPELAANHVIHGVLLATNFFGINTIPIALNEADYARMWVQAATTMTTYQAVSTAAVASAPQTDPAPIIVAASGSSGDDSDDTGHRRQRRRQPVRAELVDQPIPRDHPNPGQGFAEFPANPADGIRAAGTPTFSARRTDSGRVRPRWSRPFRRSPSLWPFAFAVPAGIAGGFAGLAGLAGIQPERCRGRRAVAAAPMPRRPVRRPSRALRS